MFEDRNSGKNRRKRIKKIVENSPTTYKVKNPKLSHVCVPSSFAYIKMNNCITFNLSFRLVEAWLQDLTYAGYKFPNFRQENISASCQETDCAVAL
jgi:hypothetical protein